MKDKKFIALSSIFFLLFTVGIGVLSLNKPISKLLKAQNVTPSPLKSFVIVFPQKAKIGRENTSDPSSKIKVSVYIRDINGSVLANRSVKVTTSLPDVTFTPSDTQNTNELGMAHFFITSPVAGETKITAVDVTSNTTIVNTPTIEFVE